MNFFKRARTPDELVTKCCNAYEELVRNAPQRQAAIDHVVKYTNEMRVMLYGDGAEKAAKEDESRQLAVEAAKGKLLHHMVTQLAPLGFETRKDVAQVFSGLLRRAVDGTQPGVDYMLKHKDLVDVLVKGYDFPETALITGSMLRECLKHPALAKHVMDSPLFYALLTDTDLPTFEVASDAFLSYKELVSRHAALTTDYLLANSDEFFRAFNALFASKNYVTKRQSIKLLGELLLTPGNVEVMMRYISDVQNLIIIMGFLRDPSRSIQFEAFHIFKVFVANPNKPPPVVEILKKNADRLQRFLSDFQSDREDEEFANEKAVLCRVLKELS